MNVQVKLFASIRQTAGTKEVQLEASTLKDVINHLCHNFGPNLKKQLKTSTIIINGVNSIHLKGNRTKLNDGDVISIFPPMGGG